jgi:hypothetical protein
MARIPLLWPQGSRESGWRGVCCGLQGVRQNSFASHCKHVFRCHYCPASRMIRILIFFTFMRLEFLFLTNSYVTNISKTEQKLRTAPTFTRAPHAWGFEEVRPPRRVEVAGGRSAQSQIPRRKLDKPSRKASRKLRRPCSTRNKQFRIAWRMQRCMCAMVRWICFPKPIIYSL